MTEHIEPSISDQVMELCCMYDRRRGVVRAIGDQSGAEEIAGDSQEKAFIFEYECRDSKSNA